ncbi:MAG: DUF362 domain-containing protein [Candidatus Omnitrophota bacterium]
MHANEFFERLFSKKLSRKEFLKIIFSGAGVLATENFFAKAANALFSPPDYFGRKKQQLQGAYDLVVAEGEDPGKMVAAALEAMGGMEKFVKSGSTVLIKPNIAWDRTPEQAANTNPDVVAALVELCFKAGAKRVNVFDNPCNDARSTYLNSGIQQAAKDRGANVFFPNKWNVVTAKFKYESEMADWAIFREAVECDTFINVPVLKHHRLTGLTLSMKNLMGICGGNRGNIHTGIGKRLVDLTDFISPDLTVIDAYRVLVRNGPVGGNLEDVVAMKKLIVGTDPTLADTYACKLMNIEPLSVPYIAHAVERNFGSINIGQANILKITA